MQSIGSSRLRSALAVVAASALLVAGVATVSEAAGAAKAVLLGKSNKETKTTKIINKGKKPALALKSKGKGPALSVNTTGLVKKLNADLVDGMDSKALDPTVTEFQLGPDNTILPMGTEQTFLRTSLPAGTYEMSFHGIYLSETQCLALNPAILAMTTPDYNQLWLADVQTADSIVQDSNIVRLTATTEVAFGCIYDNTNPVEVADSLELHVRKVNSLAAGSATPTVIGLKPAGKLAGKLTK